MLTAKTAAVMNNIGWGISALEKKRCVEYQKQTLGDMHKHNNGLCSLLLLLSKKLLHSTLHNAFPEKVEASFVERPDHITDNTTYQSFPMVTDSRRVPSNSYFPNRTDTKLDNKLP